MCTCLVAHTGFRIVMAAFLDTRVLLSEHDPRFGRVSDFTVALQAAGCPNEVLLASHDSHDSVLPSDRAHG